jgi:dUTP pyrophosphatase
MHSPSSRPRVYVAGKYSAATDAERLANTERAMEVGIHLWRKGYAPFIPHLSHFTDALANRLGLPFEYREWIAWDDCFQETCALFFYDSMSTGADREYRNAIALSQPVFRHLDDVPPAADLAPSLNLKGQPVSQEVLIQRLPHAMDLPLPGYQTEGAAAFDLRAACPASERLYPGETKMVPTGYAMALPKGCLGLVAPRSGLACKHRISLANSPGLVDSDFRGELLLSLTNFGSTYFDFQRGDRLAQMLLISINRAVWSEVAALPETQRSTGGFGSTGVR